MKIHDIIREGPNRYSTTSTNDAGVTTTKFVGGGKSVSNDAGTTTYNASGRKTNYQSPTVNGFKQELKFKGGPRIDNVKNTYTTNIGGVNVTKSTDGAGNMTSARMDSGNASVKVDNKGNKSASYNINDKTRMRVSTLATPASNMANLNKLKNVGEDSISTRTTATVNNGNRTFRKHIQKSTDTGGTSLTKVSNNGTTTKRFVRPGGSGTQTTVTPSGEVSRKNFQLKGPQTWAYDKPKTNLNASKKIKEDGVIVPGVNTTVDVKPGQTEKEAAKFFGKGKPEELHKKARKNSDPNTLYNLGLAEREIKQSDPITVLNKVMNRKANEPFPIRIHDGSTVGVSPRLAKRIVDVYDSLESEKKQKIEFLLKTKNGFKQLADLVLNMSRVSLASLQEKKK